ncbi:hypothetical protein DPEC_G00137480 [Dallia pectoralis]|uniref:Uncharacterized protein n=1 Tax=Dallia pectoralis TaxID=75939 RepID=A0ACC2GLP0_DALPE|nr:hypothetical protein DPEC_G00137480 [Dallia pectoralis]
MGENDLRWRERADPVIMDEHLAPSLWKSLWLQTKCCLTKQYMSASDCRSRGQSFVGNYHNTGVVKPSRQVPSGRLALKRKHPGLFISSTARLVVFKDDQLGPANQAAPLITELGASRRGLINAESLRRQH